MEDFEIFFQAILRWQVEHVIDWVRVVRNVRNDRMGLAVGQGFQALGGSDSWGAWYFWSLLNGFLVMFLYVFWSIFGKVCFFLLDDVER